ncbi:MAG: hypothetical protein O7B25_08885 [Gammaproteobacteria bacterium]|nr:hypothetical protein [Gammaproteobacteria bacterium]
MNITIPVDESLTFDLELKGKQIRNAAEEMSDQNPNCALATAAPEALGTSSDTRRPRATSLSRDASLLRPAP